MDNLIYFISKIRKNTIYFLIGFILIFVPTQIADASDNERIKCVPDQIETLQIRFVCEPGYATDRDTVTFLSDEPILYDYENYILDPKRGLLVFDAGNDGTINLAIQFDYQATGAVSANIYDDQDENGNITFIREENRYKILEDGPIIRVQTLDSGWINDGLVNFNLDIQVYGKLRAAFYIYYWDLLNLGEEPNVVIHVRDENHNGKPDYEWRQVYFPVPEDSLYYRTQIMVNTRDNEPAIENYIVWPLLGSTDMGIDQFTKRSYITSDPPIGMNWELNKVTHVNEIVGSRSNAGNYFIYSIFRLKENELSIANFENPFAYYDISGGREHLPTLMIRNAYYPAGDQTLIGLLGHTSPNPMNDIVYVWRHPSSDADPEKAPIWDYKLALVGAYQYETVQKIGDLQVITAEYDTFPYWVTERKWNIATFVADEGGRQLNSEGITTWGAIQEHNNPEAYQYVAGDIDSISLEEYSNISPGYRGEVAPELAAIPQLYFSQIDHKLHLLGAMSGVWNLGGSREIRYESLDGRTLNHWTLLENKEILEEVVVAQGNIFYANHASLQIFELNSEDVLFTLPPPRNSEEWLKLGNLLEKYRPDFAPDDFGAMVKNSSNKNITLTGARAGNFRLVDNRLTFTLEPGQDSIDQVRELTHNQELNVGDKYVVSFDEQLHIRNFQPAKVEMIDGNLTIAPNNPEATQPIQLSLQLVNSGDESSGPISIELWVANNKETDELVAQTDLTLDSNQEIDMTLEWIPDKPGDYLVEIRLSNPDKDSKFILKQTTLQVLPIGAYLISAGPQILKISTQVYQTIPAFILLGLLGILSGFVFRLYQRSNRTVIK